MQRGTQHSGSFHHGLAALRLPEELLIFDDWAQPVQTLRASPRRFV
jgi:hypothetical protein